MAKFLDSSGLQYFWNKIKSAMSGKQDTITDLSEIRSGAQAGSTALQSFTESDPTVPSWAKQDSKPSYTKSEVGLGNVPNVTTNNQTPTYTQATSRANLSSGETLSKALGKIAKWFADLKSVAFSGSYNDLSDKPTIPSAVTKSTVSGWGFIETESDPVFTASAAHDIASSDISNWNSKEPAITAGTTTQYLRGDKTWQTLNKSAVGLGNVPNVETNNQAPTYTVASTRTNLSSGETLAVAFGKIKKWFTDLKAVAFSGSYNDLSDTPTIPDAVTESTVTGWGFTKNTGTYSKPTGGIPKSDLASAVQTSLERADTALQSFTETDPVFSASPAAGITSNDISGWNGKEPAITAGTTSQYLRGDKTWQTLDKSAVGLGNLDNVRQYSASNPPPYPVTSVNGQTGAVTVQTGGDVVTVTITSGVPDKTFSELYAAAMDGKVVQAIDDETNYRYQLVMAWPDELDFGRTVCGGEDLISSVQGFSMFDDDTVWFSDEKSVMFMSDLRQAMNRLDDVTAPDTNYSTLMARGEKLLDATTFDGVTNWGNQLVNGAIAWRYE